MAESHTDGLHVIKIDLNPALSPSNASTYFSIHTYVVGLWHWLEVNRLKHMFIHAMPHNSPTYSAVPTRFLNISPGCSCMDKPKSATLSSSSPLVHRRMFSGWREGRREREEREKKREEEEERGKEGGREGGREERRERGKEGGREGRREREKKGEREGGRG